MNNYVLLFIAVITMTFCGVWADQPESNGGVKTVFYLVRHGETEWNRHPSRIEGITDVPLNDLGRSQAYDIKRVLEDIHIDVIYSSNLSRAYETAEVISVDRFQTINIDNRLQGRNFGSWEGVDHDVYKAAPLEALTDVETDQAVRERSFYALSDIVKSNPGKTVLVISHAGVIRNIIGHLVNASPPQVMISNIGYIKLSYNNSIWVLEELHDVLLPEPATR